jgi:aarF domain-containing kinase
MTTPYRNLSLLRTLSSTALRMGLDKMQKGKGTAPQRLVKGLDDLKGAAMKFGQMASMLDEDLLPDGWKEVLRGLQSGATPRSFIEILPIIQAHIPNYQQQILHIDPIAVHAASIGQVHKATMHSGETIALKVRYPGLENSVDSDLETLRKLLKFANVLPTQGKYDEIFERIKAVFLRELDFTLEAQHYEKYSTHFEKSDRIKVPKVFNSLCSTHTLATQWMEGKSISQWQKDHNHEPAKTQELRNKVSESLMWLLMQEIFVLSTLQSDPNPGNFLLTTDGYVTMLDFGATEEVPEWLKLGYLSLTKACLGGTKTDIINTCIQLKFLTESDSQKAKDAFVSMMAIASEPFEHNTYEFKRGALMPRIKEHAIRYIAETRFRSPPSEIVFINRRISGTQMTLEQLGGTIPARKILESYL